MHTHGSFFIHQFCLFKPFFPNILDPSSSWYDNRRYSKGDNCKGYLAVMEVNCELSGQFRMMLDSFHLLPKLKTTHMFEACGNDGRCHDLSSLGWLKSDDSHSFFVFPPLFFSSSLWLLCSSFAMICCCQNPRAMVEGLWVWEISNDVRRYDDEEMGMCGMREVI